MVVLIGHLSGARFTGGLFWQLGPFMDDAVVIFFVLSGFVIAHVVSSKEAGLENYLIARAARIYSVVVPALLITLVLDMIGKGIFPALYNQTWGYQENNAIYVSVSALLFLNQIWYQDTHIGSMLPYWSLGFEVWYYVFFGVLYFSTSKWKWPLLIFSFLVAGPKIVALFPLWLLGYIAYKYAASMKIGRTVGLAGLILSIVGYPIYQVWIKQWLIAHDSPAVFLHLDHFTTRYVVGILFFAHLIGFCWISPFLGRTSERVANLIRWTAGATFTIYLLHLPVAQFLAAAAPWQPTDWRTRAFVLLGTLFGVFLIAEFTERKKRFWHFWIDSTQKFLRQKISGWRVTT